MLPLVVVIEVVTLDRFPHVDKAFVVVSRGCLLTAVIVVAAGARLAGFDGTAINL